MPLLGGKTGEEVGEFSFQCAEFMAVRQAVEQAAGVRGAGLRKESELEVWMACKVKGMDEITQGEG